MSLATPRLIGQKHLLAFLTSLPANPFHGKAPTRPYHTGDAIDDLNYWRALVEERAPADSNEILAEIHELTAQHYSKLAKQREREMDANNA